MLSLALLPRWFALALVAVVPDGTATKPEAVAYFESKVRPILVERCYQCHSAGAEKLRGNLSLDTKAGWQKGGDIGPAIEPGDPDGSLLVQAIRYNDPVLKMPPKGKLPDDEIAILTEWVKRGRPTRGQSRRRRSQPARSALSTSTPRVSTGPISRSSSSHHRKSRARRGVAIRSTGSSSRVWKRKGCHRRLSRNAAF